MTCNTCRYFHPPDECRRHAPTVLALSNVVTVWPTTHRDDWCGEHAPPAGTVCKEHVTTATYDAPRTPLVGNCTACLQPHERGTQCEVKR